LSAAGACEGVMENLLQNFEEVALPHLRAAYNLARWLTRDETDAEDVVQEAYLRAYKHFGSFHGGDGRPWLLAIVRNTCYTWMQHNRSPELTIPLDDELHEIESKDLNPEALLLQSADTQMVRKALEELPVEFREVIVLRELEGLSYKQIADLAEIPVGTVMSRLARARKRLQQILTNQGNKETSKELAVGAFRFSS
jgi:RNA polymerase sigma-70 factor, ECF subfamily